MNSRLLYLVAGGVLLLLGLGLLWLASSGGSGLFEKLATGTNPTLNVRFQYNAKLLKPAKFDPAAEFPLRLDGQGWSFYGKRMAGMGSILAKQPGALLYDFVGSQSNDVFETWFKLDPVVKPKYEDARLQGKLGLHVVMQYRLSPQSPGWPKYFPASFPQPPAPTTTEPKVAYIENWDMYTAEDLFFFYTVSDQPLTARQRADALSIINGMKFNAVLGNAPSSAPATAIGGTSGTSPGTASP